jgi:hypothetical protein
MAGLAAAYTLSGLALLYSVVSGEYAGGMVHLDADCPFSRARTYNVVARNQVNCPSASR